MSYKDSKHPTWALLNDEGRILFGEIFSDGLVPVKGLQTGMADLRGIGENQIRLVALDALTLSIKDALLEKVAQRAIPPESRGWDEWLRRKWIVEAKTEMERRGLPLRETLVETWILKEPLRWV